MPAPTDARRARLVAPFMVGFSIACAAAALAPKVTRGEGSGSDYEGDYEYAWVRLRFGGWSLELHYWSERETS